MTRQVIVAAVVTVLAGVAVTLAQQQPNDSAKHIQGQRDGRAKSDIGTDAALRSRVAELLAEVELLELEHQVDKELLLEALRAQGHSDSPVERAAKASDLANQLMLMAANSGKLDDIRKEFGDNNEVQKRLEKELRCNSELHRSYTNKNKENFKVKSRELNSKRITLRGLEQLLHSHD